MSFARQLLLSLLVIALAAGGWLVWQNRERLAAALGLGAAGPDVVAAPAGGGPGARPPGEGQPGGQAGTQAGAQAGTHNGPGGWNGSGGAVRVVLAEVTAESTGEEVRAIGTLSAARAVSLYPQVSGIVAGVDFAPGAAVEAGAALIRLDSEAEAIAVDRARLDLATAEEAQARAERLARSGNITDVALAEARSAYRAAEIGLRSAELALERRTVRAPFAGVTGLSAVAVGDLVSGQTLITTLDDLSTLRATFAIPQRFASGVKTGMQVTLAPEGSVGLPATVSAVDSRVDPATRTFRLEATLPGGDGTALKPGMAVVAAIDFPGEERPAVPSTAIQWDREGSFVWTVPDGKAHRTPVAIVTRRSGAVLIDGALRPGDEVVVEGLQRLREGAAVQRAGGGPAVAAAGGGQG